MRLSIQTIWVFLFAILFTVSTLFAYVIDQSFFAFTPHHKTDVLSSIFGSATEIIGDNLFLKADQYFHGGVDEKLHQGQEEDPAIEGLLEEDSHEKTAATDWVGWVNSHIKSEEHYHLRAQERKEMLPFLSWAVTLNPYNLEALLTTAHWLSQDFKEPDEAIKVLKMGILNNPKNWQLHKSLADIYYRQKKNYALSQAHYQTALSLINQEATTIDIRFMNYFLAESFLEQNKKVEALYFFRQALNFFGDSQNSDLQRTIQSKIDNLEQ